MTGLTNTVTAIKNAQMAESPLLLIGGAAASLLKVNSDLLFFNKYVLLMLSLFLKLGIVCTRSRNIHYYATVKQKIHLSEVVSRYSDQQLYVTENDSYL